MTTFGNKMISKIMERLPRCHLIEIKQDGEVETLFLQYLPPLVHFLHQPVAREER